MTKPVPDILRSEKGISLIETLVVLVFFAVASAGLSLSTTAAITSRARTYRHTLAMHVVQDELEKIAVQNPSTIDASASSEGDVSFGTYEFYKKVVVVVNANGSRTVTAMASSTDDVGIHASMTSTFPLRGSL